MVSEQETYPVSVKGELTEPPAKGPGTASFQSRDEGSWLELLKRRKEGLSW